MGVAKTGEEKEKTESELWIRRTTFFLHLVATVVTTLVAIIVTIGLGIALYMLPFRATISLSLLSLIQSIF